MFDPLFGRPVSGALSPSLKGWALGLCLGLLMASVSLMGCAGTQEPETPGGLLQVQHDPLVSLPDVRRYVDMIGPYQFGTRGLARLEVAEIRLGQSGNPAGRVVLARAYLDAALYGELAGDQAIGRAISERLGGELWPSLRGYFRQVLKELEESGDATSGHVEAMKQGLELVQLLESRLFNSDYHARLGRLAEPGRPFSVEARVGRLLDLDRALVELAGVPMAERLGLLIEVLGEGTCGSLDGVPAPSDGVGPWREALGARCPAMCEEGVERARGAGVGRRGALMVLTCGGVERGWPQEAQLGLYAPELEAVWAMFTSARGALMEVAGLEGHPMAQVARAELFAMLSRWTALGLAVPVPFEAPDDLSDVQLPVVAVGGGAPLYAGEPRRFAVVDARGGWVGVTPTLAVAEQGGLTLLEARAGYSFPGALVFDAARAREGSEAQREVMAEHLGEVWAEAGAVAEGLSLEAVSPSPVKASRLERGEVVLYVAAQASVSEVRGALEVVRRGLGHAGGLKARWVVWDPERGEPVRLDVSLRPPGSYGGGRGRHPGLPEEALPLELCVVVGDAAVEVQARGVEVARLERGADGGLDREGLARALARIKRGSPAEEFVDIEVEGARTTVQELAEVVFVAGRLFPRRQLFGR
ncbi:MAG: hypothetical protein CMH57_10175 [Myxococcales bacterium]|nr:hypothetical protein [Myxococcales bacterium]